MNNLVIFTTRHLASAPRVLREIQALHPNHTIVTVGISAINDPAIKFVNVNSIRQSTAERIINIAFRLFGYKAPVFSGISLRLKDIEAIIKSVNPKFVITHEPHFLPFLVILKEKYLFKLIYNAHEYHPLEFTDSWKWNWMWKPFYEGIYRKCLSKVDLMINVCDSIADKCKEVFGKDSIVIPNASIFYDLQPVNNKDQSSIRLIHHGGCLASRKIELMIEVAEKLGDSYQLDLMLTLTNSPYFEKIVELASRVENVNIIAPVAFDQIVPFTNQYDIGIFLLPPTNFNYAVALPNKFFEFLQARLCIAIGPSPEMSRYVTANQLGIISDDFSVENMVQKIKALTFDNIYTYKMNAHHTAKQLSAEHFNELFIEAMNKI
jgi:hypothetical protein